MPPLPLFRATSQNLSKSPLKMAFLAAAGKRVTSDAYQARQEKQQKPLKHRVTSNQHAAVGPDTRTQQRAQPRTDTIEHRTGIQYQVTVAGLHSNRMKYQRTNFQFIDRT
jgi:hypothetical protein